MPPLALRLAAVSGAVSGYALVQVGLLPVRATRPLFRQECAQQAFNSWLVPRYRSARSRLRAAR